MAYAAIFQDGQLHRFQTQYFPDGIVFEVYFGVKLFVFKVSISKGHASKALG